MADRSWQPSADRVLYQLQRTFVAAEASKAQLLAEVEMLPAHYALLMNIRANPAATAAEVARLAGVTPQNVSNLVARLGDRGWVERRPHPRHATLLELHLTAEGDACLRRADALVADLERQVVAALGDDSASLTRLLTQVRETVSPAE